MLTVLAQLQVQQEVEAQVHKEEQLWCRQVATSDNVGSGEAAYAAWMLEAETGDASSTQQADADRCSFAYTSLLMATYIHCVYVGA